MAELHLAGVEVMDGGTLGIALLPAVAGREAVLVLDAITAAGAQPGDLRVLRDEEVARAQALMVSAHQIGIAEALAAAELAGCRPPKLAAVGMVPASLETGYGLSPQIKANLDHLVTAALEVLASWQVEVPVNA